MVSAIIQGVLFFIVFGAACYGVYRLMKKNGDIKDLPKL